MKPIASGGSVVCLPVCNGTPAVREVGAEPGEHATKTLPTTIAATPRRNPSAASLPDTRHRRTQFRLLRLHARDPSGPVGSINRSLRERSCCTADLMPGVNHEVGGCAITPPSPAISRHGLRDPTQRAARASRPARHAGMNLVEVVAPFLADRMGLRVGRILVKMTDAFSHLHGGC